jgi:hypothetical protein
MTESPAEDDGLKKLWPTLLHIHVKQNVPAVMRLDELYSVQLLLSNEIDMFRSQDIQAYCPCTLELTLMVENEANPLALALRLSPRTKPVLTKTGVAQLEFSIVSSLSAQTLRGKQAQAAAAGGVRFFVRFGVSKSSPLAKFVLPASTGARSIDVAAMARAGAGAGSDFKSRAPEKPSGGKNKGKASGFSAGFGSAMAEGVFHDFSVLGSSRSLIVKEICGGAVGLRIWDAALDMRRWVCVCALFGLLWLCLWTPL